MTRSLLATALMLAACGPAAPATTKTTEVAAHREQQTAPPAGCVADCWLDGALSKDTVDDATWHGLWAACVSNLRNQPCCYDADGFGPCKNPWETHAVPKAPEPEKLAEPEPKAAAEPKK